MLRCTAVFILATSLVMLSPPAEARDRSIVSEKVDRAKFQKRNVALTAVFTLLTAYVQGEVDSPLEALRYLGIGSAAGFGFYQAKRIAGAGRTTEGWLLANAAS